MKIVVTFYNHFGAVRYRQLSGRLNWHVKMAPVPRSLSSSCGTCVFAEIGDGDPMSVITNEMEKIAEETETGYRVIWKAEES